jgi:pimeloyl-ACP methyl ester carboxylesterase
LGAFTPEALDAYVRFGFAPGDDGQVHLKCDPETEAATFEASGGHPTWDLLPQIDTPVLVIAGELAEMQPSTMAAGLAERLPRGMHLQRDDVDHFGPMTHPQLIGQLVTEYIDAIAEPARTPFVD